MLLAVISWYLVIAVGTEVPTTCFGVIWCLLCVPARIACYVGVVVEGSRLSVTCAVRDFDEMERFGPS